METISIFIKCSLTPFSLRVLNRGRTSGGDGKLDIADIVVSHGISKGSTSIH